MALDTELLQSPRHVPVIVRLTNHDCWGRKGWGVFEVRAEVPDRAERHDDDRDDRVSRWSAGRVLLHRLRRDCYGRYPLLRRRHARYLHGLPPAAPASRIQNVQADRVLSDVERHASA